MIKGRAEAMKMLVEIKLSLEKRLLSPAKILSKYQKN